MAADSKQIQNEARNHTNSMNCARNAHRTRRRISYSVFLTRAGIGASQVLGCGWLICHQQTSMVVQAGKVKELQCKCGRQILSDAHEDSLLILFRTCLDADGKRGRRHRRFLATKCTGLTRLWTSDLDKNPVQCSGCWRQSCPQPPISSLPKLARGDLTRLSPVLGLSLSLCCSGTPLYNSKLLAVPVSIAGVYVVKMRFDFDYLDWMHSMIARETRMHWECQIQPCWQCRL